jgi:hypothetical protein
VTIAVGVRLDAIVGALPGAGTGVVDVVDVDGVGMVDRLEGTSGRKGLNNYGRWPDHCFAKVGALKDMGYD